MMILGPMYKKITSPPKNTLNTSPTKIFNQFTPLSECDSPETIQGSILIDSHNKSSSNSANSTHPRTNNIHLPTLQLEKILNHNTSAISNALKTTNESINMSFTLPQQDNLLDNRQTPPIVEQDNNNRDLGNPYPATET
jgi:hypothetical protein